jgi:hypothetical protein
VKTELFPKDSVPKLNTTKLGNSPRFLTITHTTLATKWFRSYRIFYNPHRCWILFLDRTAAQRILTFGFRIGWNSRSPEYQNGRQLPQISDGPSNSLKPLGINELRLSETRLVAKSEFLGRLDVPVWIRFWQNFAMTTPEMCIHKMSVHELSFLLVTHSTCFDIRFGCYEFWIQVSTLIRFWTDWWYRCLVRFLGHKMIETCCGQNTWSEDHLLSFPMPTQTHISDMHSHGYGHFGTATCGVRDLLKRKSG